MKFFQLVFFFAITANSISPEAMESLTNGLNQLHTLVNNHKLLRIVQNNYLDIQHLHEHKICADIQLILTELRDYPDSEKDLTKLPNIISATLDMKLNITGLILKMLNFNVENIIRLQDDAVITQIQQMTNAINQTNNPLTTQYIFTAYANKLAATYATSVKIYESKVINALMFFNNICSNIRPDNTSILIKALAVLISESNAIRTLSL